MFAYDLTAEFHTFVCMLSLFHLCQCVTDTKQRLLVKDLCLPIGKPCVYVAGVEMYAVGVGSAVEEELRQIASEPTKDHYFYTADFKAMNQIVQKLQIDNCTGQKLSMNINVTRYLFNCLLFNYRKLAFYD